MRIRPGCQAGNANAEAFGALTAVACATALATIVGAPAFSRTAEGFSGNVAAGFGDAALRAERIVDAALAASPFAPAGRSTARGPATAGCDAVERPPTFAEAGLETWVSVPVSATAAPAPPARAAPANAAPTPRPTAPSPSQE